MVRIINACTDRLWASAGFDDTSFCWEWVSSIIAAEFDCSPADVACIDTEERLDNITVRGEIVAYVM